MLSNWIDDGRSGGILLGRQIRLEVVFGDDALRKIVAFGFYLQYGRPILWPLGNDGQELQHEGAPELREIDLPRNVPFNQSAQFGHFMPPVKYCSISKSEMLRKFTEGNWAVRLDEYAHETVTSPRKTTRIWKDGNKIIAIITWHQNPTGVSMVVRLLRESLPEGDTIWDIDHLSKGQLPLPLSTKKDGTL